MGTVDGSDNFETMIKNYCNIYQYFYTSRPARLYPVKTPIY